MGPASRPGANLSRAADYNSRLVLDRIRRSRDGISRVEITESTSLTAQTVSNQVSRLMELGLVVEGEPQRQPMGKPRTPLTVERKAGYAVGMHVDPARVSFVVVDLQMNLVKKVSVPMPESVEALVQLAKDQIHVAISDLPPGRILGVGIATPGPVDMDRGEVIAPPNLPDWKRVPLRDLVAEATGLDTFIEKDSIAALTGELWLRDHSNRGGMLFAYMGYGVGFATASNGKISSGHSGNAGELGHLHTGSTGRVCYCGRRGCLGMITDPTTLVQAAVERGVLAIAPEGSPSEISDALDRVLTKATDGDEQAASVIRPAAEELARGLVNLVDFIDASSVVVGGHHAPGFWTFVEPAFRAQYEQWGAARNVHGVETAVSDIGEWVAAAGAASIVFDYAFSPSASQVFSMSSVTQSRNLVDWLAKQ